MYKIYAPVKDANGTWATVRFVNGVGETDNMSLVLWFKNHGYKVVDETHISTVEKSLEKCDEPNFNLMTPNEIREWAVLNGYGTKIKNTRSKEKLLEIIRG